MRLFLVTDSEVTGTFLVKEYSGKTYQDGKVLCIYIYLNIIYQVMQAVTQLDPPVGGHQQPLRGSQITIPKRSQRIAR